AHETVVPQETFSRRNHIKQSSVAPQTPNSMSPFFRGLAFIPQMLAVKIVFGVKTQLMRVNVRHGDGFIAVLRDLPYLFRVGIKEIPAAILHDTDAGMRLRRGSRQHQNQYAN